jgi:hypothetical protein
MSVFRGTRSFTARKSGRGSAKNPYPARFLLGFSVLKGTGLPTQNIMVETGYRGFYFRVLEEGEIKKGDALIQKKKDLSKITISFANRIYHHDIRNAEPQLSHRF